MIVWQQKAITIKINGNEFVTMVCSPEFIEDMQLATKRQKDVVDCECFLRKKA